MKTIKITTDEAWEMQQPFLKSKDKKRLGITGYRLLDGWGVVFETQEALLIKGLNESGTAVDRCIEEREEWIPKSQTIIFEYPADDDMDECGGQLIFVRTWLFNKNKDTFELHKFRNIVY